MSETGLILLAAGNSSRMGSIKQLLRYRGQAMIRHAAATALEAGLNPVVVVLGANEAEIRPALEGLDVDIVVNERWPEGMGGSIQTGIQSLENRPVTGAILALADQPLITAKHFSGLIAKHEETGCPIVASRYAGTAGVPVYFHREAFPLLLALRPSEGCKGIILGSDQSHLVDCQEGSLDIDTPDDYEKAAAEFGT